MKCRVKLLVDFTQDGYHHKAGEMGWTNTNHLPPSCNAYIVFWDGYEKEKEETRKWLEKYTRGLPAYTVPWQSEVKPDMVEIQ